MIHISGGHDSSDLIRLIDSRIAQVKSCPSPTNSVLMVNATNTVSFSGDGSKYDPLTADLRLSTIAGNLLSIKPDGLYARVVETDPIFLASPAASIEQNDIAYWNTGGNGKVISAAFSGTTTKTLTLTREDGVIVTAQFEDVAGGGGSSVDTSIYTDDGIINSPRSVNMSGFPLTFSDSGLFRIEEGDVTTGGVYDFNDGVDFVNYNSTGSVNIASSLLGGAVLSFLNTTDSAYTSVVVKDKDLTIQNAGITKFKIAGVATKQVGDALTVVNPATGEVGWTTITAGGPSTIVDATPTDGSSHAASSNSLYDAIQEYQSGIGSLTNALNDKAPLDNPVFTTAATLPTNTSIGSVSAAEIGYIDGVTSSIQPQLNAKVPSTRILTINGTALDLSTDRSWTIPAPVIDANPTSASTNAVSSGGVFTQLVNKVPTSRILTINGTSFDLSSDRSWTIASSTIDATPTNGSANAVSSDGVFDQLFLKAPTARVLTINGTAFDLTADRSWTIPVPAVDAAPTNSSTNAVSSGGVFTALAGKVGTGRILTINGTAFDLSADRSWTIPSTVIDSTPTSSSTNAVSSGGVFTSLASKVDQARTLTINGTPFDLSVDRTWTIPVGVTSFTNANGFTGSIVSNALSLSIQNATTSQAGILSFADWNTFNNKQTALVSGTNIKTVGGISVLGSGDIPIPAATSATASQILYGTGTSYTSSSALTFSGTKLTNTGRTFLADGIDIGTDISDANTAFSLQSSKTSLLTINGTSAALKLSLTQSGNLSIGGSAQGTYGLTINDPSDYTTLVLKAGNPLLKFFPVGIVGGVNNGAEMYQTNAGNFLMNVNSSTSGFTIMANGLFTVPNTFKNSSLAGSTIRTATIAADGTLGVGAESGTVAVTPVSNNYTILNSDNVLLVNATGGPVTLTVPASVSIGKSFRIKKIDSTSNAVIVSGGTFDGDSSLILPFQYNSAILYASAATTYSVF